MVAPRLSLCEARGVRKKTPEPSVTAAMEALRRIVRALRLANAEVERRLGLTVAQLFVLEQLADGRPRSVNEIAAATATDPSTVSGVVRRLIDRGLIDRGTSAADGRRAALALTRRGADLLARAPHAPQESLVAALTGLPARRRRALAEGLRALADRLGAGAPAFFFHDDR
jgi:DNA-binding MarR family transcriptional regulator